MFVPELCPTPAQRSPDPSATRRPLSGKGIVPGRPLDSFGIGWARTEFSNDFVPFLRQQLHLGLDREDAVEMYYNVAITRALNANPTALKKTLDAAGTCGT